VKLWWEKGAMYLDTCVEPGRWVTPIRPCRPARRTNYALREEALALAPRQRPCADGRAHPWRESRVGIPFRQAALLNIAADTQVDAVNPTTRGDWGDLAHRLGIKVMHIAERDTQTDQRSEGNRRVRQHLVDRRLPWARARSRPRWVGALMSVTSPATASGTTSAAWRRFT